VFEDKGYIIELELGVFLADWDEGDPPRTLVKANARRFETLTAAGQALIRARRYQPFKDASINTE